MAPFFFPLWVTTQHLKNTGLGGMPALPHTLQNYHRSFTGTFVVSVLGIILNSVLLIQFSFSLQSHADIIVEVAHPCIAQSHGEAFLKAADFMVRAPGTSRCISISPPLHSHFLDMGRHTRFLCFG